MKYVGMYLSLKPWARKDYSRPYGARNLYYCARETDKAVLVAPVDTEYNMQPASFWAPKSAVTENRGNGSMIM